MLISHLLLPKKPNGREAAEIFPRFLTMFLCLMLMTNGTSAYADSALDNIRTRFYQAIEQEETAEKLYAELQLRVNSGGSNQANIYFAYLGAVETLLGKHAYNPYTKWQRLQDGLKKIGIAIAKQSDNIEIRFLRFSVLHYIPSFLGYGKEREDDVRTLYKLFVSKTASDLPPKIYRGAVEFLIKSDRLTQQQTEQLQKILTGLSAA